MAASALCGALGWSTTGVHYTLTRHLPTRDAAWWAAWAVEPVISAVLLVVVAAKAYLASRGVTLRHRHLSVVESGALAITFGARSCREHAYREARPQGVVRDHDSGPQPC